MNVGLIVAAGAGKRFKSGDKQFVDIAGCPMLSYSLAAFAAAKTVDRIVIVVSERDLNRCQDEIVAPLVIDKPVLVVAGGKRRRQSVFAGLKACSEGVDLIWVHDGARPLISAERIDSMTTELRSYDGLVLAAPVADTVKLVKDDIIKSTLPRDQFWLAQTPQLFHYQVLHKAHVCVGEDDFTATDDSVLVERLGGTVAITPNDEDNLKVTTEADIYAVERIILKRGEVENRHRL